MQESFCWRFASLAAGLAILASCAPHPGPHVVLITVDSLRADALEPFGAASGASPRIARFAAQATVFSSVYSQSPHTIPSLLQLMSGRYDQGDELGEDPSLAERLADAGYETLAVVENPVLELHPTAHGLSRGFSDLRRNPVLDPTSPARQLYATNTPADAVSAEAIRQLDRRDPRRPLLLWVHYFDPHDPYTPPFPSRALPDRPPGNGDVRASELYRLPESSFAESLPRPERAALVELYREEVRYVDGAIGDLLSALARRELFDDAVVILTADHGESLGERDLWTHGRSLFRPELAVPLIVKLSGQRAGRRRDEPAELIDVVPTVLAAVGRPSSSSLHGRDLTPQAKAAPSSPAAFAFWRDWSAVRDERWALILQAERRMLFDREADPEETVDVAARHPEVVARLERVRSARLGALRLGETSLERASRRAVEHLRAIGYLAP